MYSLKIIDEYIKKQEKNNSKDLDHLILHKKFKVESLSDNKEIGW